MPMREQLGFVAMRNNVSTAHLWSIAKGAGVGWLPTYVPALGDPLIPLDIGVKFDLDIWLAYHPDAKKIPRVRHLIDWTVQSFDGRKYPVVPRRVRPSERSAEGLQGRRAAGESVRRVQEGVASESRPDLSRSNQRDRLDERKIDRRADRPVGKGEMARDRAFAEMTLPRCSAPRFSRQPNPPTGRAALMCAA